jgi:DNA-binding LacI/PurR family transcriptional regulator
MRGMPHTPAGRATMKDVAELARVSPKTVSNVVTGTAVVAPATRERVEEAMRALDFVPNLSARGLRNGRSGVIAVALPDLATAFSADLLHALVAAAHERGYAVQVEETAVEPQRERELVSRARAHLVDGLILNPIRLEDSAVERIDDLPPIVLIGEVEQHRTDRVLIDSRAAAHDVAAHVLARGARRIAVIGGDAEDTRATATSRLRFAGVRDALSAAGLDPEPVDAIGSIPWSVAGGAEGAAMLLARGIPFDALVAFTDSMAVGALGVLAEAGVRVPDDVLLTGFDDVEVARYIAPALTTVSFDRREFARRTVDLLAARISERGAPAREVVVPHRVVERASTSRP